MNSIMERFFYQQAIGHGEADSFHPLPDSIETYQDHYLEHLHKLKTSLSIPVIASLNGTSLSGWVDYGKALTASRGRCFGTEYLPSGCKCGRKQ